MNPPWTSIEIVIPNRYHQMAYACSCDRTRERVHDGRGRGRSISRIFPRRVYTLGQTLVPYSVVQTNTSFTTHDERALNPAPFTSNKVCNDSLHYQLRSLFNRDDKWTIILELNPPEIDCAHWLDIRQGALFSLSPSIHLRRWGILCIICTSVPQIYTVSVCLPR